ncbi:hypothetical protein EV385_1739 [Krasilnikovia cinnamomea]|uniref:Uncharacterized protein n=1 Tax=Krasilnikovia cinnamomea TaxID=349313 RepID=A0A4Q7ZGQ6_9ACTN|nr:hypothetical protein [Krasilnikovia cinnamomea]RZU49980.1 hypothetical protein EV385_1739 [Krasilnikovia cinnamomea]
MYLAHAFGERYDLPLPLPVFLLGGTLVVVFSFLLLARRGGELRTMPVAPGEAPGATPAADDDGGPATAERGSGAAPVGGAGWVSLAVFAALAACGLWGAQEPAENLLPTTFWLLGWIAVPLSCGLVGDWTRPVNPFAVLARLADRPGLRRRLLGTDDPVPWPSWLGWWPATLVFFAVAWAELVVNATAVVPANTAFGLLAYALVCAAAGLVFGTEFARRGEMFTVLFATWGRLGHWRFGGPGRPGLGGGLVVPFDPSPSRTAFVLLLLVSVTFDGLLATPGWDRLERRIPGNLVLHPGWLATWRTVAFLLVAATLAVVFAIFAGVSRRLASGSTGRRGLSDLLPSLLPIAYGYLLAHNLQYLLVNGQLLIPLLGNPTGLPAWPLRLPYPFDDDFQPRVDLLPSAVYWYASMAVVVAVHVVAVVVASLQLRRVASSASRARLGEYPWLAVMVAYTALSLWLLAQPLVAEPEYAG